jgi:hypothetical protein
MSEYLKALETLELGLHEGLKWHQYLTEQMPFIDKITTIVQDNPTIFKQTKGIFWLERAANYLQDKVTEEYGDKQPPKEENNYQYQPVFEKLLGDGTSTLLQGGLYTSKELAELEAEGRNKTIYKLLTILRLKKVD